MATFRARVEPAVAVEQPDLLDHPEHCSADPGALAGIGRAVRQQIRVAPVDDPCAVALFTVAEARTETDPAVVRMGRRGRERAGRTEPYAAVVDSVVPRRRMNDAEAARRGEFVERLTDDGVHRGLIAIAPHGGDIEPFTDTQVGDLVRRLAAHGVSSWSCKGFAPHAHRRFHITSIDLHEASFPALAAVIDRGFRFAVAFHGLAAEEVLVGGGAPFVLRAEIASHVEQALAGSGIPVRIAGPGDRPDGNDPRNVVNRLTDSGRDGVQLEQGLRARAEFGPQISAAVARVFAGRLDDPWPLRRRPGCLGRIFGRQGSAGR